jgi:hypothetical protein
MKKTYILLLFWAALIAYLCPLNAQNGWTLTLPATAPDRWALQSQANGSVFTGSHLINPQGIATATGIAALSANYGSVLGRQATGEPIVYGTWGTTQLYRQKINATFTAAEWLGITTVPFTGFLYPNEQGDVFIADASAYQGNLQAYNFQIARVNNGVLKWQKTIAIPQPIKTFSNVIPFSDGSMVLVMFSETTMFLTKYDANGVQTWQKQEPSVNASKASSVAQTTTGFAVYDQINVIYYNNNGVKTSQFPLLNVNTVAITTDGSVFRGGVVGVAGNVDLELNKYNATGTLLWSKVFGIPNQSEYLGQIIPMSDGGVTAVTTIYDNAGNMVLGSFYVRTDANGNTGTVTPPNPTGCTGNLLQNPGFETTPNRLANWFGSGAASSSQANTGTNALTICANGAVQQTLTATAGKQYSLSAYTRTAGTANGAIRLKFMSAGFQVLLEDYLPFSSTVYTQLTTTKTAPANTAYVEVALVKTGGAACVIADDFCLTEGGGGNPTQPDLVLQNFTATSLSSLPSQAIDGSVTVHNNGSSITSTIYVSVYLSSDQVISANDQLLTEAAEFNITIGPDFYVSLLNFGPNAQTLPGQYYLLLKVDSRDAVGEINELNNQLSFPFEVLSGGVPGCGAYATAPWQEWISKVKIGNKESISSKFYHSDQDTPFFTMVKNAANPVGVTVTWSYITTDEYVRIWIDYNHDQIYQATEKAYEGILTRPANGGNVSKTLTTSINVPASALLGQADMRVMMRRDAYPEACGQYELGEIEFYKVTIAQSLAAGTGRETAQIEVQTPDYQLFPNPAGEEVSVKLPANDAPFTVTMLNQMGVVVGTPLKSVPNETANIHEISLKDIDNGVYFLKIETEGQRTQVRRLVVSRMY